jgi:hypothetical protein
MAAPQSPLSSGRSGAKISTMTREEITARLEAVEARSETRFVELGGKLDYLSDVLIGAHGFFAQIDALKTESFAQINALKADGVAQTNALKAEMTSLKADNKTTRWTVVITLITSIMAASALILSVQANLLSAFQAGQNTASSARSAR